MYHHSPDEFKKACRRGQKKGLGHRSDLPRRPTPETLRKLAKTMTYEEMAERFKRTSTTVGKWCKEAGVTACRPCQTCHIVKPPNAYKNNVANSCLQCQESGLCRQQTKKPIRVDLELDDLQIALMTRSWGSTEPLKSARLLSMRATCR